ncbi:MAG: radical SAM protein [Rhodospirillales bacterium]|nr:radical SAM protein [Rhodospirillales bacterium]
MKVLILDSYPKRPYRISKDTIGGFGTANRFGDGWTGRAITWLVSQEVDWPPLYCVHAAGVLRAQGHEVEYAREWPEKAGNGGDYDLCLMTSSIVCHETELAAAKEVVARGVPVGVIGSFGGTVSAPYLESGAFVISGEPEMYFMANPLSPESLKGLKGLIAPAPAVPLDDLPLPAWDLIYAVHPPRFGLLGRKEPVLPIAASRGCPYSCMHYCAYPLQQGRKVRTRSPQLIVDEMAHWQDTLGVTYFIFRDPVFGINEKHTYDLCDAIEASGRTFRFTIETHLRNLEPDLAKRLSAAGMDMVKVGIETVDTEVLNAAKRMAMKSDDQTRRIAELEKLGVKLTCHYILGMPGEKTETWKTTIRYAQHLNSVFAQISVFTPYPGTPAYSEFEDKILVDNYESFTQYDLVFKHGELTPGQVRKMLSDAYRDYYLRPSWIFKYLRTRLARNARIA